MKLSLIGNKNYCATIVKIENIIPLENCDNIQATIIFGNHIIVSKETKVGDVGIFFPIETSIKEVFLKANNLYRDKTLNVDKEKSGFFELNGRVRCMKLRGFKSEGFFVPIKSLEKFIQKDKDVWDALDLIKLGTDFDHIDNIMICEKYIIPTKNSGQGNKKQGKQPKRISRLVDGQFHFHIDTGFLAKEIHKINPDDIISITEKIHGSSFISSYILCKRQLSFKDKVAKLFGVNVKETEYDYIYSSRKVVKNQYQEGQKEHQHYYKEDIWGTVHNELKPFLQKGMTIYGEVAGFLKDGGYIQKKFDYGCRPNHHDNYIYRITMTNSDGKVFEWSMLQVQLWCKQNGLKAVPMHYYGTVKNYFALKGYDTMTEDRAWRELFLEDLSKIYLEKDCTICKNKVPSEGVVVRKETFNIDVWKHKSFLFKQHETKMLDEGVENLEDNQIEEQ